MSDRTCKYCGSEVRPFEKWGAEVRNARRGLGITLVNFARDIGCSASKLSEMERGLLCAPSPALRAQINDELGLDDGKP